MRWSESQTRKEIIDQRLLKAGWNVNAPSKVTEELDIPFLDQRRLSSKGIEQFFFESYNHYLRKISNQS